MKRSGIPSGVPLNPAHQLVGKIQCYFGAGANPPGEKLDAEGRNPAEQQGREARGVMNKVIHRLKVRAKALKADLVALTVAIRDPETPKLAKALAVCVVAYALSPIDLIPDFIPVIGYLDDLILVPAGIALVLRMIPPEVMLRAREEAAAKPARPTSIVGAIAIVCVWLVLAAWLGYRMYLWLR